MTHTTLLIDPVDCRLVLDSGGNLAIASAPYAIAQDAGCILKTLRGECYYDAERGLPWLDEIGKNIPAAYLESAAAEAVESHPDVTSATASATIDRPGRVASIQVIAQTAQGQQISVTT